MSRNSKGLKKLWNRSLELVTYIVLAVAVVLPFCVKRLPFLVLLAPWGIVILLLYGAKKIAAAECERERKIFDQVPAEVQALTMEEAKRQAEQLLIDSTRYETVMDTPSADDMIQIEQMAPELRAFFLRFSWVFAPSHALSLGTIFASLLAPGLMQIGHFSDDRHVDLLIHPGDETIYEIQNDCVNKDDLESTDKLLANNALIYPSIYHLLVFGDRLASRTSEDN